MSILLENVSKRYGQQTVVNNVSLEIKDGDLDVPTGPGLGVELDEEKLAKYAEAYQKRRGHARDDVSAMRARYADWLPLKPRW